MLTHITVRGAREHNLKGIDVEIPRESLTVITGLVGIGQVAASPSTPSMPRGSAATSRACRAYARQFLEMMQKPDVEHIDGLSPAISIEQKTTPQPALDRRHRHRNLRLYAPAVGAGRRALFARHRPADRGAAGQPDGRPRRCAARRLAPLSARPGRPRPQGRVSQGAGRMAEGRLHPRPHRRPVPRDRGRARARQEIQA